MNGFFLQKDLVLTKELPPQQERGMEFVKQVLDITSNVIMGLMASNIVLNFFTVLALSFLWSLIDAQQILSILPLIDIRLTALVNEVFAIFAEVVSFDVVEMGYYFEEMFDTADSEPLSGNFDAMGFETTYFIHNMGTLLPIMII